MLNCRWHLIRSNGQHDVATLVNRHQTDRHYRLVELDRHGMCSRHQILNGLACVVYRDRDKPVDMSEESKNEMIYK